MMDAYEFHCPGHAQDFLQALGTDAPACRMILPPEVPLMQAFIDNGRWTPEETARARLRLTSLYPLCDWVSVNTFEDEADREELLVALGATLTRLLQVWTHHSSDRSSRWMWHSAPLS